MQRQVIGYARVNTRDESNPDCQIAQLQAIGAEEILLDMQSGLPTDRTSFDRLIALIENNQVREIVVTRFDRLGRSATQLQQLFNLCQEKQVVIKLIQHEPTCSEGSGALKKKLQAAF